MVQGAIFGPTLTLSRPGGRPPPPPLAFPTNSPNWIKIMTPKLMTFRDMHLRAMSLKLLPWQPEVKRSLFQFLLLDSYLKLKALIR